MFDCQLASNVATLQLGQMEALFVSLLSCWCKTFSMWIPSLNSIIYFKQIFISSSLGFVLSSMFLGLTGYFCIYWSLAGQRLHQSVECTPPLCTSSLEQHLSRFSWSSGRIILQMVPCMYPLYIDAYMCMYELVTFFIMKGSYQYNIKVPRVVKARFTSPAWQHRTKWSSATQHWQVTHIIPQIFDYNFMYCLSAPAGTYLITISKRFWFIKWFERALASAKLHKFCYCEGIHCFTHLININRNTGHHCWIM